MARSDPGTPDKSAAADRSVTADLAKALWKQAQKAADPAITAETLRTRWQALRQTQGGARKAVMDQARLIQRTIEKAGYKLEKAPPKPGKAKKPKA